MTTKHYSILVARVSLALIYFWFGILKVIGLSPASAMVQELFAKTLTPMMQTLHLPLISSGTFVIIFGIIEVIIGILFLLPGKERLAVGLFSLHMITTTLPLFFLKASVWQHAFVPTLEGQYIIKNIALIACAMTIWNIAPKDIESAVIQ